MWDLERWHWWAYLQGSNGGANVFLRCLLRSRLQTQVTTLAYWILIYPWTRHASHSPPPHMGPQILHVPAFLRRKRSPTPRLRAGSQGFISNSSLSLPSNQLTANPLFPAWSFKSAPFYFFPLRLSLLEATPSLLGSLQEPHNWSPRFTLVSLELPKHSFQNTNWSYFSQASPSTVAPHNIQVICRHQLWM